MISFESGRVVKIASTHFPPPAVPPPPHHAVMCSCSGLGPQLRPAGSDAPMNSRPWKSVESGLSKSRFINSSICAERTAETQRPASISTSSRASRIGCQGIFCGNELIHRLFIAAIRSFIPCLPVGIDVGVAERMEITIHRIAFLAPRYQFRGGNSGPLVVAVNRSRT